MMKLTERESTENHKLFINNNAAGYLHIPDEYLNKRIYSLLFLQTGHNACPGMMTGCSGRHHL